MRTKDEWRAWAREEAGRLTPEEVALASAAIVDQVRELLNPGQRVLAFLPMPGEPDLRPLGPLLTAVTRTPSAGDLTVHPYDAPRERHRWGYEQPVAEAPTIDPRELDVVLVPGVAFDRRGGRLGHGRGYYDRLLARCRSDVEAIGVTFDRFVVDRLPVEDHDVLMGSIVTESGTIIPRR